MEEGSLVSVSTGLVSSVSGLDVTSLSAVTLDLESTFSVACSAGTGVECSIFGVIL